MKEIEPDQMKSIETESSKKVEISTTTTAKNNNFESHFEGMMCVISI